MARQLGLNRLSGRHWAGVGMVLVIAAVSILVVTRTGASSPRLTRQQAIQTALRYGGSQPYPRVEAKYMRYRDLALAQGDVANGSRNDFVWVVAVSGKYGLTPLGTPTWGIAIVRDDAPTSMSPVFESGISGSWPLFFDALPDLASS